MLVSENEQRTLTPAMTAGAAILLWARDPVENKMNKINNPSRLHTFLPNILKASEVLNATVLT